MKIILVCYSGSSASILKDRMLAWCRANLIDADVIIASLAGLDEDQEDADIVLVGPQVRCALSNIRERVPEQIPVLAVDTRDYGMAKGDRIMQEAMKDACTVSIRNCAGVFVISVRSWVLLRGVWHPDRSDISLFL